MKYKLYNDHFENCKSYQIPKAQLIIADLPYNLGKDKQGKTVVEDTKGMCTKDYIIKRKLMLYKYGIKIKEI